MGLEPILGSDEPSRKAVLVVEDEPLLRMLAVEIVETAGFEAVEAENADEAWRVMECRRDIGIVFTDVNMPGSMNGIDLAAGIRDRWPPVEIIVTSGQYQLSHKDLPSRGVFVQKPYSVHDMTRLLCQLSN